MHQGDQYSVMIAIDKDGAALTPDGCEGVRVRIGGVEHRYPGTLGFDTETSQWLFPLTQAQTLQMMGTQRAQVQVSFGGNPAQIIGSAVEQVNIDGSVIRREWEND